MAEDELKRSEVNGLDAAPAVVRGERVSRPWRVLGLGAILGAAGALVLAMLIGGPLAVGHRVDFPLERIYGSAMVSLAARISAGNQVNPVAADNRAVVTGRNAFTGSCAQCHGADGNGKGVFGTFIYPPATDLTSEDAREKSDAELFWIVKNGLSFTGRQTLRRRPEKA